MLFQIIIIMSLSVHTSAKTQCSNELPATIPKYHLIEKCHRSKLGIAAKANFTSLTSCKRLAIEKRALAFNFSPRETFNYTNDTELLEYTCNVLKCPETVGGVSLRNDTRYDYYSIYAKPLPGVNSTCVSATGMFLLLPNKVNYTQANKQCRNITAVLADVASEQRTDALAQILVTASIDSAYVGMKRANDRNFYKNNSDALECITYRAWAPGHPSRNTNVSCIVLTRNRMWKTVSCDKKYQALCELIPGGPYKKGSIFISRIKNGTNTLLHNQLN